MTGSFQAARRPGPRGLAAPGLLRPEANRPNRRGKSVIQARDVRARPGRRNSAGLRQPQGLHAASLIVALRRSLLGLLRLW